MLRQPNPKLMRAFSQLPQEYLLIWDLGRQLTDKKTGLIEHEGFIHIEDILSELKARDIGSLKSWRKTFRKSNVLWKFDSRTENLRFALPAELCLPTRAGAKKALDEVLGGLTPDEWVSKYKTAEGYDACRESIFKNH